MTNNEIVNGEVIERISIRTMPGRYEHVASIRWDWGLMEYKTDYIRIKEGQIVLTNHNEV